MEGLFATFDGRPDSEGISLAATWAQFIGCIVVPLIVSSGGGGAGSGGGGVGVGSGGVSGGVSGGRYSARTTSERFHYCDRNSNGASAFSCLAPAADRPPDLGGGLHGH